MKKVIFFGLIISLVIGSCAQEAKESEKVIKIENTLKSVSFWSDSIGIEQSELLSGLESLNKAMDSIGYPDAGYKLWLVQGDTITDFKYMIEGYYPSQAIYNTIHNHELYVTARRDEMISKLQMVSYNRFTLLK